jgi:hypothetical protein
MDFYYETLNPEKGEALAEVKKENVEKLLIKLLDPDKQIPFINLVDYLLYLNEKDSPAIFTHTANVRLASHIQDVLDMMVNELYFEEHMKVKGLDVLAFLHPWPIQGLIKAEEKAEVIEAFYLWLQTPDNPVRQRINLIDIKSTDILSVINLATQ